ncbi:MAG: hypothetical protein WAM42_06500 [Candidatus Nitrosopolaris sp.]|jgi:predicted fused transcriptional regulator/phosphomethylpyrimidine kinase
MIFLDVSRFLAAVIPTINAATKEMTNAANILRTEEIESITKKHLFSNVTITYVTS